MVCLWLCLAKQNLIFAYADQLCDSRAADQRLCFCYIDSTIPLLPSSVAVGNPKDGFSRDAAQIRQDFSMTELMDTVKLRRQNF